MNWENGVRYEYLGGLGQPDARDGDAVVGAAVDHEGIGVVGNAAVDMHAAEVVLFRAARRAEVGRIPRSGGITECIGGAQAPNRARDRQLFTHEPANR